MIVHSDPNLKLAKEIVMALSAKELIVDSIADGLTNSLAEGKMKESFWKAAFERKIDSTSPANEA